MPFRPGPPIYATVGSMPSCTTGRSSALGERSAARAASSSVEKWRPLAVNSRPLRRSVRRLPFSSRKKKEVCSSTCTCAWYPAAANSRLRSSTARGQLGRCFHRRAQRGRRQLAELGQHGVHVKNAETRQQLSQQGAECRSHGLARSIRFLHQGRDLVRVWQFAQGIA